MSAYSDNYIANVHQDCRFFLRPVNGFNQNCRDIPSEKAAVASLEAIFLIEMLAGGQEGLDRRRGGWREGD